MTDLTTERSPRARPTSRPRRALIAAILSVLLPGLGQLYSGRPGRGGVVLAVTVLSDVIILALSIRLPSGLQLPVLLFGLIAVVAWAAIDAARTAAAAKVEYQERAYNRWYFYAGAIVVFALIVQPGFIHWIRTHIVEAFRYANGAMQPTLQEGDYVFAVPTNAISRGELVVHERDRQKFLHRVVGVAGDTIQMRSGQLWINRVRYPEPYARAVTDSENVKLPAAKWQRSYLAHGVDTSSYIPTVSDWGPLVIPPASYFLLGDNRGESLDSRALGFVTAASIRARVTSVYFSLDPDSGIRWNRVGLRVR